MNVHSDVDVLIKRMVELLIVGGEDDWAAALEHGREKFDENIVDMSYNFLSMYGGSGSINDIVLYKDGKVLVAENCEFDFLRTRLYEVCKKLNRI
ncbi:DUF6966 domain-containing protein [Achromobacter aegrifaciens]